MEITKDNYAEMETKIIAEIELSDFISLDLEFTGLCAYLENFLDTPEERYLKLKSTAERFRIIQFGIVAWKKIDILQYQAKPYNIYVFPNEDNGNYQLNCEVSALIFNRNQGMDFNKWIRKGVNYINSKQLKYLTEGLMEHNINLYDPSDITKCKKISLYKEEDKIKYSMFSMKFSEFFYSQQTTFEFEKLPRFFMLYIINNLQPCIKNSLFISEKNINGKQMFVMKKVTEQERKQLIEEESYQKMGDLAKSKGIKNIFDVLIRGNKIIIGHNCILDLLFCISHFGEKLPNTYQGFKKLLRESFHGIYDTKLMFRNFYPSQKETHLEIVYKTLSEAYKNKIRITIPTNEGFRNYLDEKEKCLFHQADYDAFVTGCAFVYMLEDKQDNVKGYNYKLNMMKTFYICYDLIGEETYDPYNCVSYCLKPSKRNYEFELQKTIEMKYFELIKKSYYIDNCNALLILVQSDSIELLQFENELDKHQSLFKVLTLGDYKKQKKEEEEKKKQIDNISKPFNYL